MMAENDQPGAPGGALIAPFAALLIALLGAYTALGERSGSATDVLSLGAVLESERSVRVEGLGEPQLAGLVDAWGRLGLTVGADVEDPGMRLVFLGSSTEAAASRLIRAGFERGPKSGVWRAAPAVNGGVPLVPIVLEGTGRNGGVLLTCVDESAPGRSVTYVIAEAPDAPVVHRILAALRRGTPPVRPELRAWAPGTPGFRLLFTLPLDRKGGALRSRASVTGFGAGALEPAESLGARDARTLGAVRKRIAGIHAAMSSSAPWSDLGIDDEPPSDLALSVVTTTDAWEGEAPLNRVAWTARGGRAVIGLAGTEGLGDAMVAAYLEELLLRTLGAPREPWLLDGLVAMGIGGAPGRPLVELSAFGPYATLEEAVGRVPRSLVARAGEASRLAKAVASGALGDLAAVWKRDLGSGDLEVLAALERPPFEDPPKQMAAPRAFPGGAAIRIVAENSYGSSRFREELRRFHSLGFGTVVLTINVPLPPPDTGLDGRRGWLPIALGGWGRSVTIEGDGAVLAAAAQARQLGLAVVLDARIVASRSGGLGTQMIHPGVEEAAAFGARYALAAEGAALLAERMGASGLILLEEQLVLRAVELKEGQGSAEVRNVSLANLRQILAFTRPFRGTVLATTRGLKQVELAGGIDGLLEDERVQLAFVPEIAGRSVEVCADRVGQMLPLARSAGKGRVAAIELDVPVTSNALELGQPIGGRVDQALAGEIVSALGRELAAGEGEMLRILARASVGRRGSNRPDAGGLDDAALAAFAVGQ